MLHGWKDSAAFYGDSEAFVSCLVSARERKLFKVAEESGRRVLSSVEDVIATTGDEKDEKASVDTIQDLTMWSPPDLNTSEEDFLLARPTPSPLLALPGMLLSARAECAAFPPYLKQSILDRRREAQAEELVELVDRVLCAEQAPKMFCRGLHRFSLAFLPNEFDTKLFLDYIPVLLNMAVHEQAAASCDLEGESSAVPSRRRATRKTAKKGRTHYFEILNHVAFRWDDENTAADLGKKLASAWLHY